MILVIDKEFVLTNGHPESLEFLNELEVKMSYGKKENEVIIEKQKINDDGEEISNILYIFSEGHRRPIWLKMYDWNMFTLELKEK